MGHRPPLAVVAGGLAVTGVSFLNVAFTTMRQQLPPPHLRGRVIAASRTLSWAGLPLAAVARRRRRAGLRLPVVYTGASATIVAALVLTIDQPLALPAAAGSTAA